MFLNIWWYPTTLAYHHPNIKLPPSATLATNKDLVLGSTVDMNW
jgi:hypothetical protein